MIVWPYPAPMLRFSHTTARFAYGLRDPVQRAPLPIGQGAVLVIFVNARPGMRVGRDKHYVVNTVFPANTLAHGAHLRLSECPPQIECDERYGIAAIVDQKRAGVQRIKRARRGARTITVTPQFDAGGRSDVDARDASPQRLRPG